MASDLEPVTPDGEPGSATSPIVTYTDRNGHDRRLVIRLDRHKGVPRFEQLRGQLSVMVAVGRLEPGVRLPTVRRLAEQTGLAPGTVARTYRELERDGIVITRGRAGTFVAEEPPHSEPLRERRERLRGAAEHYVFDMRQLGVPPGEILNAVADALGDPDGPAPGGDQTPARADARPLQTGIGQTPGGRCS